MIPQLEHDIGINFHKVLYPSYYKDTTFYYKPEWFPKDKVNEIYFYMNKGKYIAKNSTIVICGLARNIAKKLNTLKKRLEFIGDQFNDYRIVCFENDSEDNTRELLKQWNNDNSKF